MTFNVNGAIFTVRETYFESCTGMRRDGGTNERQTDTVSKYLLDVLFYAGIVVTVTLPLGIRFYGKYDSYFGQHWLRLTILFGISGIFALILLQELRKMFKTVLNGDCFIRENVQSLKRMGICSFCIAAVTALRLFLYLTPAVLITVLVFVIAGLFSLVLSRVFDTAVTYKLENDLTI